MKNRYYKLDNNSVFWEYIPEERKRISVKLYNFSTNIEIDNTDDEYSGYIKNIRLSDKQEFDLAYNKALELIKNKQLNSYE